MKKILLIITLLLITNMNYAQKQSVKSAKNTNNHINTNSLEFKKGDIFVSGILGYKSKKEMEGTESTFTIQPNVGYFVTNNIAAGLLIGYKSTTNTPKSSVGTTQNEFNVGLGGRYYVTPENQFSLYGQALFEMDFLGQTGGGKATAIGFGVTPGLNYFLSKKFSIEANIGELSYKSLKIKDASEASNDFTLELDWSAIKLGLSYKF